MIPFPRLFAVCVEIFGNAKLEASEVNYEGGNHSS